jgi:hypothetical protein
MNLLKDSEADYAWWCRDQEGYLTEMYRREAILEENFKKFMGEEFKNPPLPTFQNLEESIKKQIDRISKLRGLKAPEVITDGEQAILEQMLVDLKTGNYATSESEFDYRTKYFQKENEYYSIEWKFDWDDSYEKSIETTTTSV